MTSSAIAEELYKTFNVARTPHAVLMRWHKLEKQRINSNVSNRYPTLMMTSLPTHSPQMMCGETYDAFLQDDDNSGGMSSAVDDGPYENATKSEWERFRERNKPSQEKIIVIKHDQPSPATDVPRSSDYYRR